jgi:hypothetical protein
VLSAILHFSQTGGLNRFSKPEYLREMQVRTAYPSVKTLSPVLLVLSLFLSSCEVQQVLVPPTPANRGSNDFAVGEAEPYPQEVQLAKQRLQNFIRRANASQKALLDRHPFVAVQAYQLTAGQDWSLLRQTASGRLRTMYYMQDFQNRIAAPVKFLLIFDWRAQQLIRPTGVLVMDVPQRGSVGSFGGITAIYAGTGFWPLF